MVRNTDRRDVWVGLKPIERLRTSRGRRCAEVKTEQGRPLSGVNGEVRSKKDLTGPTLLEMSGKFDQSGVDDFTRTIGNNRVDRVQPDGYDPMPR